MAKDVLRLSQVVGMFGPGAMVDLPDRSVIVSGLDDWDMRGPQAFKAIEEPRLTEVLRERLSQDGRWPAGRPLSLRTPPLGNTDPRLPSPSMQDAFFRRGLPARNPRLRMRGAGEWCDGRNWNRYGDGSGSMILGNGSRSRQSASFADAKTGTCRTSIGSG